MSVMLTLGRFDMLCSRQAIHDMPILCVLVLTQNHPRSSLWKQPADGLLQYPASCGRFRMSGALQIVQAFAADVE